MQKTPISILQEMMVKKGSAPNYELIHDGGGSHENTFTYRVSCEGLHATGTGRCKKDAKHAAAKEMLEVIAANNGFLPLPASPAKSPVRASPPLPKPEPYILDPNKPFENAIGALQDLCAENELQDPVYNVISDVGPPHARIFTMQCTVSSFKEEGTSTTKKQAKHLAARKMYQRITEVLGDANTSSTVLIKTVDQLTDNGVEDANEKAKKHFIDYKGVTQKKMNLGVKLADFHKKIRMSYSDELKKSLYERLAEFEELIDKHKKEDEKPSIFDDLILEFQEILNPLNIEVGQAVISNNIQVMSLSTTPEIVEIGIGGDVDQWKVMIDVYLRVISTLKYLLD